MTSKLTRTLLGIAVVATVAACVVNLSFTYPKPGVAVKFTGATMSQEVPIDLSTQAEVAAHKNNVQDLTLDSLDATVVAVGSGNQVTTITGNVKLRPDAGPTDGSKDVQVGTLTAVSVTVGTKVHLVGTPALDALVLSTIKGSGKATAIIAGSVTTSSGAGTASTVGDFTLDLALHLSMAYQP